MSTYNGQKYIKEQIDSLLRQKGVKLNLIIRDDGSMDDTLRILSEYELAHPNIIVIREINCGAEESFNRLCRYALKTTSSDYYAFCDQDDVWDEDKLEIAVSKLENFDASKPNLYFSNLKMVDNELHFIRNFFKDVEVFTDKDKALVQIFTYGCTCVFNHKALEAYCGIDKNKVLHDNWIYALCVYFGNVIYDPTGHILYRQHGNNLSGKKVSGFSLFILRLRRAFTGHLGHDFEIIAKQLLSYNKEINAIDLKQVELVANYRKSIMSKLHLLFSTSFRTGKCFKDLCIKYRILINAL